MKKPVLLKNAANRGWISVLAFLLVFSLGVCLFSCAKDNEAPPDEPDPTEVTAPPAGLGLDPFYKKYVDANGLPVVSSGKVADKALMNAKATILQMVKNIPDAFKKIIENKVRVGIIGVDERTTEMPEYRDLYTAFPGTDWDQRARGFGATHERPLSSVGEENITCMSARDRWRGEDIFTHEFAHTIHLMGLRYTDPGFDPALLAAYNNAKAKDLWTNTYAITNEMEYWAEGVQCWFNNNLEAIPTNGIHNHVNTRQELLTYDETLYNLIKKYMPEDVTKLGCY